MFEKLKAFVAEIAGPHDAAREFEDGDYRLAITALLVHAANADGFMAPAELERLHVLIETQFGLDQAATARLIAVAEQSDREAVDFFHFTNVLKRKLDDASRHKIIEMMWEIVLADGTVTEFEENIVWRVAELLGVSTRDRVLLRQEAAFAGAGSGIPRYDGVGGHDAIQNGVSQLDAPDGTPAAGPWGAGIAKD